MNMGKIIDLRSIKKEESSFEEEEGQSFLDRWDKNAAEVREDETEEILLSDVPQRDQGKFSWGGLTLFRKLFMGRRAPRSFGRWGIAAGLAALATIFVLVSTVFARITVVVKPTVEKIQLDDILTAFDTSVSRTLVPQRVIPAEVLEFTQIARGEFDATGNRFVEEKARGTVRIYNEFSSSPQALVANTRLVASDGKLYRLLRSIVVPGAKVEAGKIVPQFLETEAMADEPGEGSNLSGEARLSIPGFKDSSKYDEFYGIAPAGFSGGFRGEARVVTAEDLKRGEEEVTREVYQILERDIAAKVPQEFTVIQGLRKIEIISLNVPKVNSRHDKFSVEAGARGSVMVFREEDVVALLGELILKDDASKKIVEGSANLEYQIRTLDPEGGRAEALLRGSVRVHSLIPQEEIAAVMAGQKEGSIIEILKNRREIAEFKVAFFPPWLIKAPGDADKIRFRIEEVK